MLSPDRMSDYAQDPVAFWSDLEVEMADGSMGSFGTCAAPFQWRFLKAMAPALRRLCGQRVEVEHTWAWEERSRGSSKSSDAMNMLLYPLAFASRQLRLIAVACDKDQASVLGQLASKTIRANPVLDATLEIGKWKITNTRTGSEVEIMASDVASLYGQLVDGIVADEVSLWQRPELWESVISTMAKRKTAVLLCLMNCGWLDSWQYGIRGEMAATDHCYFHSMTDTAPWITQKDLDTQRRLLPKSTYSRLWENVWVSGTGDGLDPADIEAAITLDGPMHNRHEGYSHIGAIDLGIKHDHSAFVVLAVDHQTQRVKLAWCQSWRPPVGGEVQLQEVYDAIMQARYAYGMPGILYDPWQGEFLAQSIRKQGMMAEPVPFTGVNLNKMATVLLEAFRSKRIDLYNEPDLIADLHRVVVEEKPYGFRLQVARTADGGHGDRAMALAIALPTAIEVAGIPPAIDDGLGDNLLDAVGANL